MQFVALNVQGIWVTTWTWWHLEHLLRQTRARLASDNDNLGLARSLGCERKTRPAKRLSQPVTLSPAYYHHHHYSEGIHLQKAGQFQAIPSCH